MDQNGSERDTESITGPVSSKDHEAFGFEDHPYHSGMLDSLNMLRKNRQFCDVILQIGSANQEIHEVHAHRVVLASASAYFLELFSSDPLGLSTPLPQHYRLTGHHFDPEAFDRIIDYAYTARLTVPAGKAREIYTVASRLKMNSVVTRCGQFLLSTLTPETCLELRNLKAVLRDPNLLQAIDAYIRQHFEQIVHSKLSFGSQLVQLNIDFHLSSEAEESAVNERHMVNEVLEWLHSNYAIVNDPISVLKDKEPLILFLDKERGVILDGAEVEPTSPEDADAICDYKKRQSLLKTASCDNIVANGCMHNGKSVKGQSASSKPRQFMFTRSDSESSLSSAPEEDSESIDWKVLATCRMGPHSLAGLVTVAGRLTLLSIRLVVPLKCNGSVNGSNGTVNGVGDSIQSNCEYCLIPPMSSPRCAVGTAELGGKLFVCGGYDRVECLKTVEVYDTLTNKWETLQHMQVPRGRFAIAVVDDNVYAIGGCDGQNDLNSGEFYDPHTLNWKLIPSAPVVRSNAGVCSMESKIYVIGGWSGNRGLNRCDVYDPNLGQWTEIGPLHKGRYQTAVCTLDGIIYAVGGGDSWNCLNSVEAYVGGAWCEVAPLQTARRGCGVATHNGKIYAIGGCDGVSSLSSVEIYDPSEDRWTFGKPMTVARVGVGVAVVGNRLYAVGGFNGKTFLNTIEYFDFDTEEWTTSVPVTRAVGLGAEKLMGDSNNNNTATNTYHPHHHHPNGFLPATNSPSKLKNSRSVEPLVEVEETLVGH